MNLRFTRAIRMVDIGAIWKLKFMAFINGRLMRQKLFYIFFFWRNVHYGMKERSLQSVSVYMMRSPFAMQGG